MHILKRFRFIIVVKIHNILRYIYCSDMSLYVFTRACILTVTVQRSSCFAGQVSKEGPTREGSFERQDVLNSWEDRQLSYTPTTTREVRFPVQRRVEIHELQLETASWSNHWKHINIYVNHLFIGLFINHPFIVAKIVKSNWDHLGICNYQALQLIGINQTRVTNWRLLS